MDLLKYNAGLAHHIQKYSSNSRKIPLESIIIRNYNKYIKVINDFAGKEEKMQKSQTTIIKRMNPIYPNHYAYIYIMPAVVLMILMCVFPVGVLIWNSFTNYSLIEPDTQFVGLKNYIRILQTIDFYKALGRSLVYSLGTVTCQIVGGFILALLYQVQFRGKKLLRSIMLIPMVAAPVAIAFLWSIIFNPSTGILNYLLGLIGIPPQMWTSAVDTALPSIILVDVWQNTPFVFLIFSSAMVAMPEDVFEAAIVDGADFLQSLKYILIPLMRPVFVTVLLLRTVDSLKAFDLIYTLTAGGPGTATQTINILVYLKGFSYFEMGEASAMAFIMYIIIFIVAGFIIKKGNIGFN